MRVFPCENSFKFKHKTFTRVLRVLNIGEPRLNYGHLDNTVTSLLRTLFFGPEKINRSYGQRPHLKSQTVEFLMIFIF